ncbi:MAG: EAL domain-containing protein [Butyrivibrio sp.]|nr:EAL domain-containing protein [Butyrivibrio sp.]
MVLCFLILILMSYTKPRITEIYTLNFFGVLLSIPAIIVDNVAVSLATKYYDSPYCNYYVIAVLIWAFIILYFFIILCIFWYVSMLAPNRRGHRANQEKMTAFFAIIYFVAAAFFYVKKGMLLDIGDSFDISGYMKFYIGAGLSCATLCIIETLINRKNLAKTVFIEIMVATPLDMVVLILQYKNMGSIFMSTTYVAPFLLFYILFHSNPFDEQTGCQNSYAFDSMINMCLKKKRRYVIARFSFPQLDMIYSSEHRYDILNNISRFCRDIEKFDRHARVYRITVGDFIVLKPYRKISEKQLDDFYEKMKSIVHEAVNVGEVVSYGRMVSFNSFWYLKSVNDITLYFEYLNELADNKQGPVKIAVSGRETENNFVENRVILEGLENIALENNLDDPRVICYAQPIYDVKSNNFKTAEALMRLRLDNKMIPPYKFIPLAEKNGYIHILTRIMLNKVCISIKELEEKYDFDAITVNCAPAEFSDVNMYADILEIIELNDIDKSKIRLELTESAMFDNYEAVKYNMERLEASGIRFYLDDFGSGYSNIERISTCDFMTVKFDKTLLYKAMENKNVEEIIISMIDMLKRMGMITLVEGVEDEEQSSYCIEHGFDFIQGFKYAKPAPINQLSEYFVEKVR